MKMDMNQIHDGQDQDQAQRESTNRLDIREEDIAAEAYALWEARGCQEGRDLEDWLEAEQRLRDGANTRRAAAVSGPSSRDLHRTQQQRDWTAGQNGRDR